MVSGFSLLLACLMIGSFLASVLVILFKAIYPVTPPEEIKWGRQPKDDK